jgi:hypothetical protein
MIDLNHPTIKKLDRRIKDASREEYEERLFPAKDNLTDFKFMVQCLLEYLEPVKPPHHVNRRKFAVMEC